MTDCVFCNLIANPEAPMLEVVTDSVAFVPLNPVTEGHFIVVPKRHIDDAMKEPSLTGQVMCDAAYLASERMVGPCNFITSCGKAATQTVFHLHIHVVPRREGDGLHLPWTGQAK